MRRELLWAEVGYKCLSSAYELLKKESTPTVETAEVVQRLTEAAVLIGLFSHAVKNPVSSFLNTD